MRTNVPHIFAIGDIVGQPMLAHKAVHEGHVAAETAAGKNSFFDAKVIPSVAYTDPEVAWVGVTENEAKANGIKYGKGVFPWAASGRSLSLGRDEGVTKVLFDEATDRIIGCGIVGPNAGRSDRRSGARHRDGRRRAGHRPDDPPASDAVGDDRHGGRGVRGHDHRPLHAEEAEGALKKANPGKETAMASKQDPAKAGDDRAGVPDNVRQAAESALAQAKKAVDQCMQQATRLQETVGSSAQRAQSGARSVNQKVLAAAEANISATFDFAQRLVHATNAQEIVALQHEFVKQHSSGRTRSSRRSARRRRTPRRRWEPRCCRGNSPSRRRPTGGRLRDPRS